MYAQHRALLQHKIGVSQTTINPLPNNASLFQNRKNYLLLKKYSAFRHVSFLPP